MEAAELIVALAMLVDQAQKYRQARANGVGDWEGRKLCMIFEYGTLPGDAITQLRAAIRTPAETEALAAFVDWWDTKVSSIEQWRRVKRAIDALPDDAKARLRGQR